MTMRSWIRKLFARPPRKGPRRARLAVEALEQRCVPTFTVTNLLDDGSVGSLRWAVGQANMTGGDQTIDFDPTVFGTPQTITLAGTQLELTDTTGTETITGPAAGVTVDGGGSRVFRIDRGVTASVSGLTISDGGGLLNLGTTTLTDCTVSGNNAFGGGGISNTGTATLTNCTVSGNSTGRYGYPGGGISNTGTATLTNCTVSGNSANGASGGGLYNRGGTVTLTDCTVSGNADGGLSNRDGGTVTLTDCTVSGNFGGGLQNGVGFPSGALTLTNCTVSGNSGGGIYNLVGTLTVSNSTLSGNTARGDGGGIVNFYGTVMVSNSTLSGNTAFHGGGIYNSRTLTVSNSTLSGNTAFDGGGIYNSGTLAVSNSTLSGNTATADGGGIWTTYGITVTLTNLTLTANRANTSGLSYHGGGVFSGSSVPVLHNTLIAGNFHGASGTTRDDVYGALNPGGDYNLIGDGTGMTGLSNGVNGNLVGSAAAPIDPLLGPLQDNGGPTKTHALLAGSPALNAGDPAQLGVADQRGVVRSGGVNIGAYQASATAFLVSAPDTVQPGVPFDVTVTAVDPFSQVAVGYTGTVTFGTTDTDPGVVLPADYAFVADDGGMHRFTDTGLGEITLVTPGDQMLTVMDTADNTITGRIVITVSAGPAPHGHGPPPRTVSARPPQGEAPAPIQPSASEVVGLERWFASFHDGDYVWLTVPRLRHQARGDTTLGMAGFFGGEDLFFP
jgi:hypothetical protein